MKQSVPNYCMKVHAAHLGHALEEGWVLDVGGALVPGVELSAGRRQGLPTVGTVLYPRVHLQPQSL